MQETPFKAMHEAAGAKLVDFAGWNMPVWYTSMVEEHLNVRNKAGLFDVTHMGRIMLTGKDHMAFADHIATNSRASMKPGQVRYNLICNEGGTILDDVLIYAALKPGTATPEQMKAHPAAALSEGGTMIVCNAGNHPKISAWIEKQRTKFDVRVDDVSRSHSMLALQGKTSQALLQPHTNVDLAALKYYRVTVGTVFGVANVIVSRTGYTGEDGFELIFPNAHAQKFWDGLLAAGKPHGLKPTGLGARDTLRLEAGMPLYGHEIDDTVNPIEAGLDWAVALDKPADFNGKAVLAKVKAEGPSRLMSGLVVESKRIVRQGMKVMQGGKHIGTVASGTKSPTLGQVIGTALLPASVVKANGPVEVEMKVGELAPAKLVPLPFYSRKK